MSSGAFADDSPMASLPAWEFEQVFPLPEVPEPSGLCYYPAGNSLFIVDDGGAGRQSSVNEIDLQGTVLQSLSIGVDLEAVCYCSADGLIYVADEHEERLYVLDPAGLQLLRTIRIDRFKDGTELMLAAGNGFEGIEYIPADSGPWSDHFILLNQDDPHRLLAVRRADLLDEQDGLTSIASYHDVAAINTGELHFDAANRQLWVIHSWMNVMEIWNVDDLTMDSWEVVPGAAQEAVCIDGEGRLWIGSDLGSLACYTPLPD